MNNGNCVSMDARGMWRRTSACWFRKRKAWHRRSFRGKWESDFSSARSATPEQKIRLAVSIILTLTLILNWRRHTNLRKTDPGWTSLHAMCPHHRRPVAFCLSTRHRHCHIGPRGMLETKCARVGNRRAGLSPNSTSTGVRPLYTCSAVSPVSGPRVR